MDKFDESSNEPILYELLEYNVWKQEPELIKCKNDTIIIPNSGTIKNALRYLNNRYSLPESISRQVNSTLPWKFAVGDNGRFLAILQENVIEIRKAKDEYSSVLGKASVPKDAFPQWRKIIWSPDGTILVLASSNGYTSFYNSLGNNIFNISPKTLSQNIDILEAGDAIASMIFLIPQSKEEKWSYQFLLISYSGLLRSYYISPTNGYTVNYEFSFENVYKNGINAVVYDDICKLLYVAGNTITQKLTSTAVENGLTSWRMLNDDPHIKLSFNFDNNGSVARNYSLWNFIPSFKGQSVSLIFKMKISPCSKLLACLHTDGSVSIWNLPNLTPQRKWKLIEQPDFNVPNPLGIVKNKKCLNGLTEFYPVDVGWWSDEAIIIARYSGSISVCSITNLQNLLGASPEFLAGQPQISNVGTVHGFLCLDCEMVVASKKRSREPSVEGHISEVSSESEDEDNELEAINILNYTMNVVQSAVYSITDIEKFQPKRKKSKLLHRTYKILGLRKTTPEELYSRKIDLEEYEEALALAQTYNLDTDFVYQTQWRKSELSLDAIREHLSKVRKRSWVLNECVTRVPDSMDAARELLNFGLRGGNLETLLAIGEHDHGKFVPQEDNDWDEENDENIVNFKQIQKANEILEKIDLKNLSDAQKDLIRYRRQLLDHSDKLMTYEIILQPPLIYNKNFYEQFRQLTIAENAVRFAKDGDYRAVEIMFNYHGKKLLPHWLAIISFFPETLNPLHYEKLLPECDSEGQLFLLYQCELRRRDWSEREEFDNVINLEGFDEFQFLYDADPSLCTYRNTELTPELLRMWYKTRAYQIERNSFVTDNALQLIKIGKLHNILGLEELLLDLETLDDLVYKVYLEEMNLDQFEKLTDLEKIKLLMSMTNEGNFIDSIKNLVLPFIKRKQRYTNGDLKKALLHDYLVYLSKDDLSLPVRFFEYVKQSRDVEVISTIEDIHQLALDCLYACDDVNMHEKAKRILDSLIKNFNIETTKSMLNLFEELEKELECGQSLQAYGVKSTLNDIREHKNNPEAVKLLLTQMARNLNKSSITVDENEWAKLLNDMLRIHGLVFSCVDVEVCFEICVSARLVSGNKTNIQNCAALIETRKSEQSLLKVSYEKAVNLILEASKEYFNSSKSLTDPNMELAKACLHLIVDNNAQIKEEYDLINSLQILNEFNMDVLPLQVRLTQDRLKLIGECLCKREDAYKSKQRLLTLASYLKVEGNNIRTQEGKVLNLIAEKSLEVKDYNVCSSTCLQLMQNNYIRAWQIIRNLGCCKEFHDLKIRKRCLWFAINNGPDEILSSTLKEVRLIEIQELNNNLQTWMPMYNDSASFDNGGESEDEFTDAMTTPQIENKEFVPKVIETSTEIVKNSANLMKQSTYGLIKNISNTNFWKSQLKVVQNITKTTENDNAHETESQQCQKEDRQSFPCFYASLHSGCKISGLYSDYTKYSMPDIENPKLKYCQLLLRIAMLSESSDCGVEVKDISHLLLECATHTLSEDWLLGLSYLLSLNDNSISCSEKIFTTLPCTELLAQSALYYYSLQLHKKLYKNSDDLYLYDPSSVIQKMLATEESSNVCDIQKILREWHCRLRTLQGKSYTSEELDNGDSVCDDSKICEEASEDGDEKEVIENVTGIPDTSRQSFKENVSNSNDDVEWTEDWGDFPDDNDDVIDVKDFNTLKEEFTRKTNEEVPIVNDNNCSTEEARYTLFEKEFQKISSMDEYVKLKTVLLQWPKFTSPEFTTVESHPMLKMMRFVGQCLTKKTDTTACAIFQEYKELSQELTSTNILQDFLMKNDVSLEQGLYIRLCTENTSLHKEAVDILVENYQSIALSSCLLEELFLKNLTGLFDVSHVVYRSIIDHVFVNQSLATIDIKENTKILIDELLRQKHIMHAMSILNFTQDIPASLKTFDSCLQRLMQM